MSAYEGETYTVDEYKKLNTATGKEFGKAGEEVVGKQAQDWRNQGSPMPGTKDPEDIRSLGSQLIDWATTPAGNATLGGLGLLALGAGAGVGLKGRKGGGEPPPRVEPTFNDLPPTPPSGGPRPNFPQGDVTDVASRPVGQPRAGLPSPTGMPPSAPSAPSAVMGGAPAPAGVAPAPVAPTPAPVDPLVQAKLDAIAEKQRRDNEAHTAQQRRLDEAHQIKVANEAKRAEMNLQKNQGKASTPTSADAQATQMIIKSEENKVSKAVASTVAPKPVAPPPPVSPATGLPNTPAASVIAPPTTPITPATPAPAPTNAPTIAPTTTPAVVPERAPSAAQASNIKEISLPKEWPTKGMNWITSVYGVDGAQQFIDKYNDGKPFKTHAEMQAVYDRVMVKPSFSTMPKELRKERGIKASERDVYKMIPRAVPPPAPAGGSGQGGGLGGGGRQGTDNLMHSINPLKL
jgi:hypothetical protein